MTFVEWWTDANNSTLEFSQYIYGPRHIALLIAAFGLTIFLLLLFRKKSEKSKNILLTVLASILLFYEISTRIVNLIILNDYTLTNIFKIIMPLHICSVAVWVLIIGFFTKNKLLLSSGVVMALVATSVYLLCPGTGINKVNITFTATYSIISHTTGFILSVLLIGFGYIKLELHKIWQTYLAFGLMLLWGALVDFVILPGSDYMYLRNNPLPIDLVIPHQIIYGALLAIYIFMFYYIYYLKSKKTKKAY